MHSGAVAAVSVAITVVALIIVVLVVTIIDKTQYKLVPHYTQTKTLKRSIPRVMYKTGKTEQAPKEIENLNRMFVRDNPGWKVRYYGDRAARRFIARHFNRDVVLAFDALQPGAFKADLFRLCILYVNGGVYSDLSQRLLVPIRNLVDTEMDELVFVADKHIVLYVMQRECVHNSFIAAVPKHAFLKHCINRIVDRVCAGTYGFNPLDITGPYMLGRELHAWPDLNYRMQLVRGKDNNYIEDIDTGEQVIQHKQPNHYAMLKVGGRTYTTDWILRRVYDDDVRARMSCPAVE